MGPGGAPVGPTPTGSVVFYNGSTQIGAGTLISGTATLSISTLAAAPSGTTITASYGGDSNYTGSTASLTQTVNQAAATVTLSNLTQTYTGSALTPTATTTPSGLSITWTGAPDTNAGNYPVTATVSNANYSGYANGTFTIGKATPTVLVASSSNPSPYESSVTFTATVTPSTATGTVTFYDGSNELGTGTLSSGTAPYSTSTLAMGTHSITANYGGDSNDSTNLSPALNQGVGAYISSLSPGQGIPLAVLTITGAGFGASQGTSTVTLNEVTATVISNEWSNTSITVLVPMLVPGTVPVIVIVNGIPSNSYNFVVTSGFTCQ